MDFVAIDFETANKRPDSACQLAAVVVQNSEIVAQQEWLIRPPRNYFSPRNISIHGISPSVVARSPKMDSVWQELAPLIDGHVLLAHNARFDMGVLVESLAAYRIICPDIQFQCTRALARSAWPNLDGYGLRVLGDRLAISFQHHDALEDARCCAKIALAIEAETGLSGSLTDLEQALKVTRGSFRAGQFTSPRQTITGRNRYKSGKQLPQLSVQPASFDRWGFPVKTNNHLAGQVCTEAILSACEGEPLVGKKIVMLGPLRGLSMQQTIELLNRLGAEVKMEIDLGADYIVVPGAITLQQQNNFIKQEKESVVQSNSPTSLPPGYQNSSGGVRVLSERQFRALLPGGAASKR
jgi:DNA polymerase-3 subunit epsilon